MSAQPDSGLDIIDLFTDALDVFRAHAGQYLAATLVVLLLQAGTSYFPIAGLLLMGPLVMGLFQMALAGVRGKEVLLGDALCGFNYFVSAVLLNLAVVAFAIVGLAFCVLPGLFIFVLFLPSYFFLLDGVQTLREAFALNRAMFKRDKRAWMLVAVYFIALQLVGFSVFTIGLLLTLPIGIISLARLYDRYAAGLPLSGAPPEETYP